MKNTHSVPNFYVIEKSIHKEISEIVKNSSLRVYNTLTRSKEVFQSIEPGKVRMYSCGPTVYSDAHIWNLRSYIFPDILKWLLLKIGYEDIRHIINITDVGHLTDDANDGQDKMELSAQRRGETVWEISEKYAKRYFEDIKMLWIEFPEKFTKATDYIAAQIEMVQGLEAKWYTYNTKDGIYFDTAKFPEYADFARLDLEALREWERVDFWDKRNKADFALWKFSPENEKRQMEWESPWWVGFPGWHIECSAMISQELGDHIDIHTGGIDHIHVHHTNEIAQATCFHGKKPVNYWMHGEFLVLGEWKRIGKSEWNAITLSTLIEKGFSPLAYRYLALTAHYRNFLNFSFESLKQAEKSYEKLKESIYNIHKTTPTPTPISSESRKVIHSIMAKLLDDLGTAGALVDIRSLIWDKEISGYEKLAIISFFDEILWLNLFDFRDIEARKQHISIPQDVLDLGEKRRNAKTQWNYGEADLLRKEIEVAGYNILDFQDRFEITKK